MTLDDIKRRRAEKMMNVKPRLGRIPQGSKDATYFFTAKVCLRVTSQAAILRLQKLFDKRLGLQGGAPDASFKYYRWSWPNEPKRGEWAQASRARNGVGRPPKRKLALKELILRDPDVRAQVESFKKAA